MTASSVLFHLLFKNNGPGLTEAKVLQELYPEKACFVGLGLLIHERHKI